MVAWAEGKIKDGWVVVLVVVGGELSILSVLSVLSLLVEHKREWIDGSVVVVLVLAEGWYLFGLPLLMGGEGGDLELTMPVEEEGGAEDILLWRDGERGGEREVVERSGACREWSWKWECEWEWDGGKLNSGIVSSRFSRMEDMLVLGEEEEEEGSLFAGKEEE